MTLQLADPELRDEPVVGSRVTFRSMSATARRIDRVVDEPRNRPRSAARTREPRFNPGRPQALQKWSARVEGRFFGIPLDVDPHEALLQCIRITAGEVAYCNMQIEKLYGHEMFETPTHRKWISDLEGDASVLVEERHDPEVVSRWVALRDTAVERLAKFSKMALDAGVDERNVALAERVADAMVPLLRNIAEELRLTPSQRKRLPAVIEGCLRELEA